MLVATSELSGAALDWVVAKCEGNSYAEATNNPFLYKWNNYLIPHYSTDWSQGGTIIERLMKEVSYFFLENDFFNYGHHCALSITPHDNHHGYGASPLIASMRCYVSSKLGDYVEIPNELVDN